MLSLPKPQIVWERAVACPPNRFLFERRLHRRQPLSFYRENSITQGPRGPFLAVLNLEPINVWD